MRNKFYLFFLIFFLSFHKTAYTQTSGIGEVTSIESKVITFENNKLKISQCKSELINLEALWKDKIKNLKEELAALYKERDDIIADMKVGARCSQCKEWKTTFIKKGINFEQHLGEVKGYAIPATTEELEATRKTYTEKIALKKVQIQNLEKGDNAVNKKLNEISSLEKANETLCKDITAHSKNYEKKVLSEATAKHDDWVKILMEYAINILIADDKITIYKARIIRFEEEFKNESERVKERVKKENLDAQNNKNAKIALNQEQIKNIQIDQTNHISTLELKISELKIQKEEIETELTKPSISDSLKNTLQVNLDQLISQIDTLEKSIIDYNVTIKNKISSIESENKKLKDEIFQLNSNLLKQQNDEIAKIKPIYDQKKLEASQSITKSNSELSSARKLYSEKAEFYKKQNQLYVDQVVSESSRMVIAGQKISCPIWNEVRFQVMQNWNNVFPCVNSITTMAKPYSTNVFNAYCPGKSAASYMASYKSFLNGLSEEDKNAVKGNSNAGWYEYIVQ